MIEKRYVCTEYECDMEIKRIRATNSLEEAKEWLECWSREQNERFHFDRTVNVDYQNLYAEVIGEEPIINYRDKSHDIIVTFKI